MSLINFAQKYRPRTFAAVRGQPHPVRFLSGLIRQGQVGRPLLLHGAIGSGKTSLVRIYAKALNCERPDRQGSPCQICENCRDDAGFHEYDTSGRGGEKEKVVEWVSHRKHPAGAYRWTVLFFDEAHALEYPAADALLKAVEEPEPGLLYCFATTEFERIRPALRSRLHSFEIKPLQAGEAVALLTECARAEGIEHEPGALELLAGLRQGYARDLLNGLEQVRDPDGHAISIARVRAIFDVDHTECLLAYARALASGDPIAQEQAWFSWNEAAATKIGWLQALLTGLYYNDVLGRTLIVDPLISSILPSDREPILAGFRTRLGVEETRALAPYWRAIMGYWPLDLADPGETALQMHITLFHDLINQGLPVAHFGAGTGRRDQQSGTAGSVEAMDDETPPSHRPVGGEVRYLTADDVHDIIESASFFTQEHGRLFNARIRITPALLGAVQEEEAVAVIANFCDELDSRAAQEGAGPFARLSLIERDLDRGGEVTGRIVVHLPVSAGRDQGIDAGTPILAWIRSWRRSDWLDGCDALEVMMPATQGQSLRFHWDSVLDLCAGLDEDAFGRGFVNKESVSFLDRLRIPRTRRRLTGGIAAPLVGRSDLLGRVAVSRACANGMHPLSALAWEQWDRIQSGWELQEHEDRTRTKAERSIMVARTAELYGKTSEGRERLRALAIGWERPPEERQRRALRGWWHPAEA